MTKTNVLAVDHASVAERDLVDISFVQWDSRWLLFSDGRTGVYAWDGSTTSPYKVRDMVPFLPKNDGGTNDPGGSLTESNCPYIPAGRFMTKFRGRLFMANPFTSTVYYSGTRTDLDRGDGPPATTIKPWELWNVRMDLSRYNPGHGGNMIVGTPQEYITGMAGTDRGLYVFKANSVYSWNWPDNAAPGEAENGASIDKIIDGIGAFGQQSISQSGDDVVFIGQSKGGDAGVYLLSSDGMKELSETVPESMRAVLTADVVPMVEVLGDYVIVAYKASDGLTGVRHVYDMVRGAWVDFTSPEITNIAVNQDGSTALFGTETGTILAFPSKKHQDVDITDLTTQYDIPVFLLTGGIDYGTPIRDKKFRKAWSTIKSSGELDIGISVLYDSEDSVSLDTFTPDTTVHLTGGLEDAGYDINHRGKVMYIAMGGDIDKDFAIEAIQSGARDRTEK